MSSPPSTFGGIYVGDSDEEDPHEELAQFEGDTTIGFDSGDGVDFDDNSDPESDHEGTKEETRFTEHKGDEGHSSDSKGKHSSAFQFEPVGDVTNADQVLYAMRMSIALAGVGPVGQRLSSGGTKTNIRLGLEVKFGTDFQDRDIKRSITCVLSYCQGIVSNSGMEQILDRLKVRLQSQNENKTYERGGWDVAPDNLARMCAVIEQKPGVADHILAAAATSQVNGPTRKGALKKKSSTLSHYFGLWAPGFIAYLRMVALMEKSGVNTFVATSSLKIGTVDKKPKALLISEGANNLIRNYPVLAATDVAIVNNPTKRKLYEAALAQMNNLARDANQLVGGSVNALTTPFFATIPTFLFPTFSVDKYSAETDSTVIRDDKSMQLFVVLSSMLTASTIAVSSLYTTEVVGLGVRPVAAIQSRILAAAPYKPETLNEDADLLERVYLTQKFPSNSDVGLAIARILRRTKSRDFKTQLQRGPLSQLIQLSQFASTCVAKMSTSSLAQNQYINSQSMANVYHQMYRDLVNLSSSGRAIDNTFGADDVLALSSLSSYLPSYKLSNVSQGSFWDPG